MSDKYTLEKVEILGGVLKYIYILGKKDLPTLVMLHEGLGSISTWKEFPKQVSNTIQDPILLYSRHVYGASSFIKQRFCNSYMHDEALKVLPALISRLKIGRVILYGHSDGASIAAIFAGSRPATTIEGVILEAPHVFVEEISIEGIEMAKLAFKNGKLKLGLKKHHHDPDRTFKNCSEAWLDPDFLNWNIQDYMGNISAPVLLIQGENDAYGSLKQLESIEPNLKVECSRIVLEGIGHSPHKEEPASVLHALKIFIEER